MQTSKERRTVGAVLILTGFAAVATASAPPKTYWWNDTVFYEIFVRSFYDSNGDGIGDLRGLIEKLDYLNDGDPATTSDLGVTGIWLMPICPSPSYHGYDVTDYRGVEPDYGNWEDFHALIEAAHARGIKVIVDFVMNHSSDQHPLFLASTSPRSPYRNWYIWSAQDPGYLGPWGQQVWYFRNGAYYFGLFWSGMPDLNYANPDVKNEMFDVAKFWLTTGHVDGFRLDAIKHIFEDGPVMENVPATFQFLQDFRRFYRNVDANAMTVGEVASPTNQIAPYCDGTGVDFCFEFPLATAIINGVNSDQLAGIKAQMQSVLNSYPYLQYAPFLTNHDHDRVFGRFGQDITKMKLAAAVYLTLPGVPFLYYGEEVGMIGAGVDENKRTPMQWTSGPNAGFTRGKPWHALNANYGDFNVHDMQGDPNSLWHWYRALLSVRNEHEALRRGDYTGVSCETDCVYAYARRTDREVVTVAHNFGTQAVRRLSLTLSESHLVPGVHTVWDLLSGQSVGTVLVEETGGFTHWRPSMAVAAQGTAILSIDLAVTPRIYGISESAD